MSFGNLRDDSDRLNEHTQVIVEELAQLTKKWAKAGIDARAVYAGFAMFRNYYRSLGYDKLGASYIAALDSQADKLATELLARRKPNIPR